jgi:hypothetical protein
LRWNPKRERIAYTLFIRRLFRISLVAAFAFVATSEDFQMINTSARAAARWAFVASASFILVTPAWSQAPTEAQRSAIRSECRSDYMAHCSEVPPGGMASLQCLQSHMSSLSADCQGAVRAVEKSAEPKAEAQPAAKPEEKSEATSAPKPEEKSAAKPEEKPESKPEPATATATPAEKPAAAPEPKAAVAAPPKKPSSAQVAAIRSACRSDYMARCAGVPTGGAAALSCLQQNKSKLSARCQQAVNAVGGGSPGADVAAAPASGGAVTANAAAATVPAPMLLRPMRPREVMFVLRSTCGGDVRALCGGVPPGGGRIVQCLAEQAASLSPGCRGTLASFAQ